MIQTILCPTDFSKTSVEAVQHAVGLSGLTKAELYLFHVIPYEPFVTLYGQPIQVAEAAGGMAELRRAAQEKLSELMHLLDTTSEMVVTPEIVEGGNISERICEKAAGVGADMIVMATHGRTGLERVFLGSVAERVIRLAPCSVLVHRSPTKNEPDASE